MRLGVLGGTFDPVHVGHLVAASEAAARFELDSVLFVPAARPWQKGAVADPEDRLLMATLATAPDERFAVSRIELDRRGPSYTADTLEILREFYEDEVDLLFIAGADAAVNVGTWHDLGRVAALSELIVVTRPGWDLGQLPQGTGLRMSVLEIPPVGITSTEIRRRIREGRPIDYLVPAPVVAYIQSKGLYSSEEEALGA